MSNIKPDSIIALLDTPNNIKSVLDTSLWVSNRLGSAIGLLYSRPSSHKKTAINYSGCLNMDEEDNILHDLASEEYLSNLAHKNEGKELLQQSQNYCESKGNKLSYPLHRQCTIEESLNYIDDKVDMIITGADLSCKTTLANLIRPAQCPILVTHPSFSIPRTALFAFDNKDTCHRLVQWLADSRFARDLCIHIVMIAEKNTQNKDAIRESYAKLTQAGIKCKKQLINHRDVPTALLNYQRENKLDLLISGAFGQSRLREWIQGSETEKLLNNHQTAYLLFPKDQ